jgi:1-acyl-sn-glycerol-3-phosphate acyltransferase
MEKEQTQDSKFYRTLTHLYIDLVLKLGRVEIRAEGLEKIPTDGRFLLVCNHICDLDSAFLLKCFPKSQLCFIGKQEIKTMPLVGKVMHKMLCQFINRENDREALKTIIHCISILKERKANVAVFPEGKKSTDRYLLHHFRPGVFKMAQKADVPIVVCTLQGTQNILPNARKLRRTDIRLNLLEVIPAAELKGITTVDIAHRVHGIMAADLGTENVAED